MLRGKSLNFYHSDVTDSDVHRDKLITRILVSPNHLSHKVVIVEHISHIVQLHRIISLTIINYNGKEVISQVVFIVDQYILEARE